MSLYDDVMTIENGAETELAYYAAIQRAINAGSWGLQGSFGRAMMDAIESGRCMLGENSARDYYGNRIPSRHEVLYGTKGSRGFVVDMMGAKWAIAMEDLG